MKKTDAELQAIRDKLKLLDSEPAAGDTLPVPWSTPMPSASQPSASQGGSRRTTYFENAAYTPKTYSAGRSAKEASPQAAAIEALKKRSATQSNHTQNVAGDRQADSLIAQEIHRLEVHAQNINERSQQQAAELLAMKRSAQQAALVFRQRGFHDHPQLEVISELLKAHASATVPQIERDSQGYFNLTQSTVDLHRAEQEAVSNAETLRNRLSFGGYQDTFDPPFSSDEPSFPVITPFTDPIENGLDMEDYELEDTILSEREPSYLRRKRGYGLVAGLRRMLGWRVFGGMINRLFGRRQRSHHASVHGSSVLAAGIGNMQINSARDRFSWLDGTIWFSAAAITRIILEAIVLSYPLLRMPLLLIIFSAISFSIYRVVVSPSANWTSAYRLGVVLLGLFLGSSLS